MKYVIATATILVLAIGVMVLGPRWANAQGAPQNCGLHKDFIKGLKNKYNETGSSLGIAGETMLVEVYTSPGGATWTILSIQPNGFACIIAAGKDWMTKPPVDDGTPS